MGEPAQVSCDLLRRTRPADVALTFVKTSEGVRERAKGKSQGEDHVARYQERCGGHRSCGGETQSEKLADATNFAKVGDVPGKLGETRHAQSPEDFCGSLTIRRQLIHKILEHIR